MNVLIVDDEAHAIRRIMSPLKVIFEELNAPTQNIIEFLFSKESDFERLEELLQNTKWNLLVTDLSLVFENNTERFMFGHDLLFSAKQKKIPSIVATGAPLDSDDIVELFHDYEIKYFFRKGNFSKEKFGKIVREILPKSYHLGTCNPNDFQSISDFINADVAIVDQLKEPARQTLALTTQGCTGFAEAREAGEVQGIIKCIYNYFLNEKRIVYEYAPFLSLTDSKQAVRSSSDVINSSQGTCLDLSLMFLAFLKSIGLAPIYIQIGTQNNIDHALAGCWLSCPNRDFLQEELSSQDVLSLIGQNQILIVDCTGFARSVPNRPQEYLDFETACQLGKAWVENKGNFVRFVVNLKPVV